MAKDKGKEFIGPRGICVCGHTGVGENSQHDIDIDFGLFEGLGKCLAKGCDCEAFRGEKKTRKYQNFLTAQKDSRH